MKKAVLRELLKQRNAEMLEKNIEETEKLQPKKKPKKRTKKGEN
jgi:hypothetical protein